MLRRYSPLSYLGENRDRIPSLFVARAFRDNQWLNGTVDRFVAEALAANVAIEVMNHPDGQHGFDIFNPDVRSRGIICANNRIRADVPHTGAVGPESNVPNERRVRTAEAASQIEECDRAITTPRYGH